MNTKKLLVGILVFCVGGFASGCKRTDVNDAVKVNPDDSSKLTVEVAQQPIFDVELWDGQTLIYQESTRFGVFQMERGKAYTLKLNSSTAGISAKLNIVNGSQGIALGVGDNQISGAAVGSFIYKIEATAPGALALTKSYDVGITCTSAEDDSFEVNSSGILVSSAATNLYNYTTSGIAMGGSGSYQCSWDFNGDGIRDNDFGSCTQQIREYSNHVDTRMVGVFVRDTVCNKVLVAEAAINLIAPATVSAPEIHIMGTISGAENDERLNLRHLSTNPSGVSARVNCSYSRKNGKGTFTVSGLNDYDLSTSQDHGLKVSFSNIDDNVAADASGTFSGSVSSAGATINRVEFFTDESPDGQSRLSFRGDSSVCSGSITATHVPIAGVPCGNGTGEIEMEYVVRGEGSFSCTGLPATTATDQSVNIRNGSFYCEYRLVDACSGGGGGGGGGVAPVEL